MACFSCVEDEVSTMITDEFREETGSSCDEKDVDMLGEGDFEQIDSNEVCVMGEKLNYSGFISSLKSGCLNNEMLTRKICEQFNERNIPVINSIVSIIGKEHSILLVQDTFEAEERGGMLTEEGTRRSSGGVFLKLVESRKYLTDTEKRQSKDEIKRVNRIRKTSNKNKKRRLKLKALKKELKSKYLSEKMPTTT